MVFSDDDARTGGGDLVADAERWKLFGEAE